MNESELRDIIRTFILEEFLPGEGAGELTDDVDLFNLGILDSIGTLKLVSFLEERFEIVIEVSFVSTDNLNTIDSIVRLVASKL